jgi:hypothetical protein
MQIRNPHPGTLPLQMLAITSEGKQYTMSCISNPLIDVADDVVELVTRWQGPTYDISKVWTAKAGCWLEMAEYNERKAFEAEKVELERLKKIKKTIKTPRPVLDVKVTNEDNTPTKLEQ